MNIPQIIKNNKDLSRLFNEVSIYYKVQFKQGKGVSWSSYIEKKKKKKRAIIHWIKTKVPEAAIAHELLHLKTQGKGYKKIKVGQALDNELLKGKNSYLEEICKSIDNEIQHQKMYKEYLSMGFKPEAFYIDSDIKTEARINEFLTANIPEFYPHFVEYLVLIAPGGYISDSNKNSLKKQFRKKLNGQFKGEFDQIDKIISNYIADKNNDAEKYIVELFQLLKPGRIWIGYGTGSEFPKNGFFVNEPFNEDDINLANIK